MARFQDIKPATIRSKEELETIRNEFVSADQAAQLRKRYNEHRAWAKQFEKPNGWTVIPADAVASCPCPISNNEVGKLEQFDFYADMPDRYFGYINEELRSFTTWTGDFIGHAFFGRSFCDNFGGQRVPIDVVCLNGVRYSGTYYRSSGNYARIRKLKPKSQPYSVQAERVAGLRPQDLNPVQKPVKLRSRDSLRRQAKEAAEARGHSIKWDKAYHDGTRQFGACRNGQCGKGVFIVTKPEANESRLTGEALATRCLYNPKATY